MCVSWADYSPGRTELGNFYHSGIVLLSKFFLASAQPNVSDCFA